MRFWVFLVPIRPLDLPPPPLFPSSFPSPPTLSAPVLNVHQDGLLRRDPKQGRVKALNAAAQPAAEAGGTRVGQPVNVPAAKRHLRRRGGWGKIIPTVTRRVLQRDPPSHTTWKPPALNQETSPPYWSHLQDRVNTTLGAGNSPARRPGGHSQYSNQLLAA